MRWRENALIDAATFSIKMPVFYNIFTIGVSHRVDVIPSKPGAPARVFCVLGWSARDLHLSLVGQKNKRADSSPKLGMTTTCRVKRVTQFVKTV